MPMRVPLGGSARWIRLMMGQIHGDSRRCECRAKRDRPGPRARAGAPRDPTGWRPRGGHTRASAMSGIARTNATGAGGMLPELLAWSSSFRDDRALVREDLIGSAAHVTML